MQYVVHTDVEPELAQDLAHVAWTACTKSTRDMLVEFAPPQDTKKFEVYIYSRAARLPDIYQQPIPNTGGISCPDGIRLPRS